MSESCSGFARAWRLLKRKLPGARTRSLPERQERIKNLSRKGASRLGGMDGRGVGTTVEGAEDARALAREAARRSRPATWVESAEGPAVGRTHEEAVAARALAVRTAQRVGLL